jgi:hypothetical protein
MTNFNNFNDDYNSQPFNLVATTLIDTPSSTEIYIGTSKSFKDTSKPLWQIKKIWQDSTVWKTEFPNGDQGFKFIWEIRGTYTYS